MYTSSNCFKKFPLTLSRLQLPVVHPTSFSRSLTFTHPRGRRLPFNPISFNFTQPTLNITCRKFSSLTSTTTDFSKHIQNINNFCKEESIYFLSDISFNVKMDAMNSAHEIIAAILNKKHDTTVISSNLIKESYYLLHTLEEDANNFIADHATHILESIKKLSKPHSTPPSPSNT